jgi:anti-anti-sigma factor
MQPLATAKDVPRSFREIETSIFHGRTSPDDLINPIHLIKDMGFMNAVGAPSPDLGPIGRVGGQSRRPQGNRAGRPTGRGLATGAGTGPTVTAMTEDSTLSARSYPVTSSPAVLDFDHRMEWGEDTLLVSLRGPLVDETLGPLQACWEAVRAEPRPCVVLDLSEVPFMASAALESLVGLWRWLKARGYGLRLSALSLNVRHVLHRTRLEQIFPVEGEPSVTAA